MCDADAGGLAINLQSLSSDLRVDACLDLPGSSVGIQNSGVQECMRSGVGGCGVGVGSWFKCEGKWISKSMHRRICRLLIFFFITLKPRVE